MLRVGENLLLHGGGLLHKGKPSANFSLSGTFSLLNKEILNIVTRKMVWITVNDAKVDQLVDVMKLNNSDFSFSDSLK